MKASVALDPPGSIERSPATEEMASMKVDSKRPASMENPMMTT